MDAYNTKLMEEFLKILDEGNKDKIKDIIQKIKQIMKSFADEHSAAEDRRYLYNNGRIGKLLMFNVMQLKNENYLILLDLKKKYFIYIKISFYI